jgi:hypothetical protein
MTFKEKILSKYKIYPRTHEYLSQWIDQMDYALKEEPDFLNADWNDPTIVENYMSELPRIIPFYCQFPNDDFVDKITNSKLLKSLEYWIVSFEKIENCVDILVKKYPELEKDEILHLTSLYVNLKCSSEVFQIICLYHKDIKMDLKNYYENLKKRMKETPNNISKSESLVRGFTIAMMGEIVSMEKDVIYKDKLYTFDNLFEDKKISAKSITDNFSMFFLLVFQKLFGDEIGARKLLSILPGGKQREIIRQIPLNLLDKYKQRELFRDLFNFLRVFAIDENLLSEKDYQDKVVLAKNGEEFPYKTYKDYMESKAKIIFGLT